MGRYLGFVDLKNGNTVCGSAWDPAEPNARLYVEVSDGVCRHTVIRASLFREDLRNAGIGDGCHGFSVTFPGTAQFREDSLVSIKARVFQTTDELTDLEVLQAMPLFRKLPSFGWNLRSRLAQALLRLRNFGQRENAEVPSARALRLPLRRDWSEKAGPDVQVDLHSSDKTEAARFGKITNISGHQIEVLIVGSQTESLPMVFVGLKPAKVINERVTDGCAEGHAIIFTFETSGIIKGDQISLWAMTDSEVYLCESRIAYEAAFERSPLLQMSRAAKVATQRTAVAVTCWEGGHNPIGRAKVLYDVVKGNRPVVLFCFLFPEFGGEIWAPFRTENENIVTIPWSERFYYLSLARAMGIEFDTVWMCKPRLPTFELAAGIAGPDARLVLDIDDNEEHFSRSKGAQTKAYGAASIGVSRQLMANVPARTAASAPLVRDFDAVMVRHARCDLRGLQRRRRSYNTDESAKIIKIGFIGTVRTHKRVLEAARRIRRLNSEQAMRYEFHVYGDIQPEQLCLDLQDASAVVRQNIPADELPECLGNMDVILSGFPSRSSADNAITKYQISSKIGDALSIGKPVLVPEGPSVKDLGETPGVFLFSEETFEDQLMNATRGRSQIFTLPRSFSLKAAYDGFLEAERRAESALRMKQAIGLLAEKRLPDELAQSPKPTLLLIWKQHDAGYYGRRIDQVCRAYGRAFPEHRVVVLEILHRSQSGKYDHDLGDLTEFSYIRTLNNQKQSGRFTVADGTEYRQVKCDDLQAMRHVILEFLGANKILPTNAVIVVFPNVMHLDQIYDLIHPYPLITDVVDNQLSWMTGKARLEVMRQYFSLVRMSDQVIFNSENNAEFFKSSGMLSATEAKISVIPNWYQLPAAPVPSVNSVESRPKKTTFDVFYSGNMNDRIDWGLMDDVAGANNALRLHLIGEAGRAEDEISRILQRPNVLYHGPLPEFKTLELLAIADLTILPHVVDKVSKFMNPLKVHMYAALNLQTLATDIPGVGESDLLTVCRDRLEFLNELKHLISRWQASENAAPRPCVTREIPENGARYIDQIAALRATYTQKAQRIPTSS